MIKYFIDLTIIWTVLLLFYHFLLRGSTHFQWSRVYLLATLILGPTLPLMIDFLPSFFSDSINDDIVYSSFLLQAAEVKTASVQSIESIRFSYKEIFLITYITGILVSLTIFLSGIYRIYKVRRHGQLSSRANMQVCLHEEDMAPFTFLNTIYLPKDSTLQNNNSVIEHELAHIDGLHSTDVIIARLFSIIFWCAIPVHLFHRLLSEIHEYIADKKVLDKHTYDEYLTELIYTIIPKKLVHISQSSASGNLIKRLKMMKKQKTSRWQKAIYLLAIPILFVALSAMSVTNEKINSDNEAYPENTSLNTTIINQHGIELVVNDTIPGEEIFKVVEESPRFPGCEDILEKQERQECAQNKMLEYLYTNIKYPESARKAGVEGMVVIQFVIEKDGSVSNTKVLRDIGEGCGEEGMRVMNMINSEGIRWIPGIQKGEAVRVQFALPISFKLDKKKKEGDLPSTPPPPPPSVSYDDQIFKIVEEMPYLADCQDEKDRKAREKCSQTAMMEKLYSNLKYPQIARENGIQGQVIVSFVVNTDGSTSEHKILRDIGADCGEAALTATKLLQEWVPGRQRGKAVRVQYTLPVTFKLEGKKKKEKNGNSE